MGDAASPKELGVERRPERGWRYAEANREGRGVRAISDTDLAAMLIASSRLISAECAVTARRSRRSAR
ncbi:MAG: hypothetical protein ACXWH5_14435, partial [Actinomycetota bacterium]